MAERLGIAWVAQTCTLLHVWLRPASGRASCCERRPGCQDYQKGQRHAITLEHLCTRWVAYMCPAPVSTPGCVWARDLFSLPFEAEPRWRALAVDRTLMPRALHQPSRTRSTFPWPTGEVLHTDLRREQVSNYHCPKRSSRQVHTSNTVIATGNESKRAPLNEKQQVQARATGTWRIIEQRRPAGQVVTLQRHGKRHINGPGRRSKI